MESNRAIYRKLRTDGNGAAKIAYPQGLPMQTIGIVKEAVGCDYRAFETAKPSVDQSHANSLPQGFEGHLDFVLNGVRSASVSILDPNGTPLSGVRFDPCIIRKPNRGGEWNLPGLEELSQTTNNDGTVQFNVIPSDQERGIAGEIYHALNRGNGRMTIFHKDEDYEASERVLNEGLEKYPVSLFAYQWLPNHWHMVVSEFVDTQRPA